MTIDVRQCEVIGLVRTDPRVEEWLRNRHRMSRQMWAAFNNPRTPHELELPNTITFYIGEFLGVMIGGDGFVNLGQLRDKLEGFYLFHETFFFSACQVIVDEMIEEGIELDCRT